MHDQNNSYKKALLQDTQPHECFHQEMVSIRLGAGAKTNQLSYIPCLVEDK
jgi:hypothetical protein